MKSKSIRTVCLCLAILLTVSLSACGATSSPGTDASSGPVTSSGTENSAEKTLWDPYAPFDEPVTITMVKNFGQESHFPEGDSYEDNAYTRFMEKTMNIKVDYLWYTDNGDAYKQKIALSIASRNIPDTFLVTDETTLKQLTDTGLIMPVDDLYNKMLAQYLKDNYASYSDGNVNNCLNLATFNGKLMAFPNTNAGGLYSLLWLRKDWLDKVGLQPPQTLDDLIGVIKAFQQQDPGGNGPGNTIGLPLSPSLAGNDNTMNEFSTIFGFFNAYPKMWIKDQSGETVWGSIQPEAKTALEKIAGMYKDGIIDNQFAVRKDQNEPIYQGRTGTFFGPLWMPSWPLNDEIKKDPVPEWAPYISPVGDDGKLNVFHGKPTSNYQVISTNCKVPQAIVKMINIFSDNTSDSEGTKGLFNNEEFLNYGKLGVSWSNIPVASQILSDDAFINAYNSYKDLVGSGKPNDEEAMDESKVDPNRKGWAAKINSYLNNGMLENGWYMYKWFTAEALVAQKNVNVLYPAFFDTTPTMATRWASLLKLESETYLKIIMGEEPISAFDDYVTQWKQLGGDQITREVNDHLNK